VSAISKDAAPVEYVKRMSFKVTALVQNALFSAAVCLHICYVKQQAVQVPSSSVEKIASFICSLLTAAKQEL
jgi:hypothetical protein